MGFTSLDTLLSGEGKQIKHNALGSLKKHAKTYKLAISSIFAFPEMYCGLLIEKESNLIPPYEYQLAYLHYAAVTFPILYAFAVMGTYIDLELFKVTISKFYKSFINLYKKFK
jgi:hypothetical protein